MNDYGVSFAPTRDNAAMGQRNGQLSGVPQAIQVLSLALPRVMGARPVAPTELLTAQGGEGIDPIAGSVLETLMKAFRRPQPGQPGSLPGGTAGPNPFPGGQPPTGPGGGGGREGSPFPQPGPDPGLPDPGPTRDPQIHVQPNPGGWTPGAGPYEPRRPFPGGGRRPV